MSNCVLCCDCKGCRACCNLCMPQNFTLPSPVRSNVFTNLASTSLADHKRQFFSAMLACASVSFNPEVACDHTHRSIRPDSARTAVMVLHGRWNRPQCFWCVTSLTSANSLSCPPYFPSHSVHSWQSLDASPSVPWSRRVFFSFFCWLCRCARSSTR